MLNTDYHVGDTGRGVGNLKDKTNSTMPQASGCCTSGNAMADNAPLSN